MNIYDIAAGQPVVWIRFQWNDNSHYYWCIDDFELSEGFQNEIKLEKSWLYMTDYSDQDIDEGFFYMVPFSQTGSNDFGGYTFAGALIQQRDTGSNQLPSECGSIQKRNFVYNENSDMPTYGCFARHL
jgi:hypothetical protein